MANLDNFFAKKDKKKKGGKKKFTGTSTAEMGKALETPDPAPSSEPEKKEFQIDLPNSKSADDEWDEVEEKEKDLEGLKIRSLRVDDTEEGGEKPATDKQDEDSDSNDQPETVSASPWQVVTPQVDTEPEEEPKREASPSPPPAPPPEDEAKKPSVYVPPYLRNQPSREAYRPPGTAGRAAGGSGVYRPPGRRGNAPPDIQNPEAFPSLKAS